MKIKRASEYYGINPKVFEKLGVFDLMIGVDNLFFVDPLLLDTTDVPEFEKAFKNVRGYFRKIVVLLKTDTDKYYREAVKKLCLKELKGIGIGYGTKSDDGGGIGPKLAKQLANTGDQLIKVGIENPEIFEIMGLFEENFGPDRLSDAVIRINEDAFYAYSERMANELGIKERIILKGYQKSYQLPKHPYEDKYIIFVPKEILSDLPVATTYSEIAEAAAYNEELRVVFNNLLSSIFKKGTKKPERKGLLMEHKEGIVSIIEAYGLVNPKEYDFANDPLGLNSWYERAKEEAYSNPIKRYESIDSLADLDVVIHEILDKYKFFIEKNKGWRGLYNDKGIKLHERAACLFFHAIASTHLDPYDVDISPQSDAGRGPVDFKLSSGKTKIVVELKLTSGKIKSGYQKQTREYQTSEEAQKSYFVVVRNTDSAAAFEKIKKMESEEAEAKSKHPAIFEIDGRWQESASK